MYIKKVLIGVFREIKNYCCIFTFYLFQVVTADRGISLFPPGWLSLYNTPSIYYRLWRAYICWLFFFCWIFKIKNSKNYRRIVCCYHCLHLPCGKKKGIAKILYFLCYHRKLKIDILNITVQTCKDRYHDVPRTTRCLPE